MRLIGADTGAGKLDPDDVADHFFKGQPVLFVHRQQKCREHDRQHDKQCRCAAKGAAGEQIGRNAQRRPTAEADELPLGEVERDLRLDFG